MFVLAVDLTGCSETAGNGKADVFPCTEQGIRGAIARGGGPHTFACNGPQTVVTEAEIVIDNDVILDGESKLTVDAGRRHADPLDDHRVFSVTTGVTTELRAMTVTRGLAQDAGPVDGIEVIFGPTPETFGGGIVSAGTLTLTDTTVSQSDADAGGGIYSEGTLMLTGSTVGSGNYGYSGAGIVNAGSGTLTLANSTVSGNQAATFGYGLGAGIHNEGEMTVTNSIISGNLGQHAEGGGIYNAASGTLSLINSTVSRNYGGRDGPAYGGGIYNRGEMTIINSTVSENRVAGFQPADPWIGGFGGGIYSSGWTSLINTTVASNLADYGGGIGNSGTLTVTNSTVSGNTAHGRGSGIDTGSGIDNSGTLTLTNSTVSGNTTPTGGSIYNDFNGTLTLTNTLVDGDCATHQYAAITSNGYNIESPGDTCGFDQGTDQVDVTEGELKLGELADNGGPTMTHALGKDSVAIDQIPEADCEVDTDQRRLPRPAGTTDPKRCDVGAFEVQP
jgi:hypothetical protein